MDRPPKKTHKRSVSTDATASGASNTLSSEACNCFIGALGVLATESLHADFAARQTPKEPSKESEPRQLKNIDDLVAKALSLDTAPMHLNLVGLRRRGSLTNRFDDVILALYREPERDAANPDRFVIPEPVPAKGKLPPKQPRRTINEHAALDFVKAVGAKPPDGWPTPGESLSCKQHLHWRAIAFVNTTDPGYSPTKQGQDDARNLPWGIAAIEPGKHRYRVGFHHFSKWSGYVAGHASTRFPAKRRYAVAQLYEKARNLAKKAGELAIQPKTKREKAEINNLAKRRAKDRAIEQVDVELPLSDQANPRARARQQTRRAQRQKSLEETYFDEEREKECVARNGAAREPAYRKALHEALTKHGVPCPIIRLEDAQSAVLEDFEKNGEATTLIATPEPEVGRAALVLEGKKDSTRRIPLEDQHVLVVRTMAEGTNLHRSVASLKPGTKPDERRVNSYSAGCQVFRDPGDFYTLLRLLQLSKRVQCATRGAGCTAQPITRERLMAKLGNDQLTFAASVLEAEKFEQAWAIADQAPAPRGAPLWGDTKSALDQAKKGIAARVKTTVEEVVGSKFVNVRRPKQPRYVDAVVDGILAAAATVLDADPDWQADEPKDPAGDVERAVDSAWKPWEKSLREAKAKWTNDVLPTFFDRQAKRFTNDHAESCDFDGVCKVTFPYLLVELSEEQIRGLLARLETYTYESLFPAGSDQEVPGNPVHEDEGEEDEE